MYVPQCCTSSSMFHTPSSCRQRPKSSPPPSIFFLIALDPLKHNNVALRIKKEIFTRMYLITSSYLSPFLVLIFSASSLWNFWHSCPIAPDVVNMSGVRVPCSTWMIRLLYWRFFSCSCLRNTYALDRGVTLTDAVGVGHSDIKEGVLAIPPETPRSDV